MANTTKWQNRDGFIFEYRTYSYEFRSKPYKHLGNAIKGAIRFSQEFQNEDSQRCVMRLTSFYERKNGYLSARIDCGPNFKQPVYPEPLTGWPV